MKLVLGVIAALFSFHVMAQSSDSNETSVKAADVLPPAQPTGVDIDDEITNAKLRASSVGSKNPLSMKFDMNLNGGNLETPLGVNRPNYSGSSGNDPATSLSGTIAAAYRLDERSSLRFGGGLYVATPFQDHWVDITNSNGGNSPKSKTVSSISNPYLDYSRAFRSGNSQNIIDTSFTYSTIDYQANGYQQLGNYDVNYTIAWDFKNTKWSPGINIDANYTFYKDGATATDTMSDPSDGRTDWTIAAFPYIEYAFNSKYSFRTVSRFLTFDHYRSDNSGQLYRELFTQSVGIGISVTRDIYLYPNLQFAPEYLEADRTNVGLSTSINL